MSDTITIDYYSITWDNVYFGKKEERIKIILCFQFTMLIAEETFSIMFSQGSDRQPVDSPVETMASHFYNWIYCTCFFYNFKF